jgi:hypothetical protein
MIAINDIISYLETTPDASWCTDVVRTKDQRNCLFGHLFEMGGNDLWDDFEEVYATTFMVYRVNDGNHPDYQQSTPKQRCIAYLKALAGGTELTTYQIMEMEAERSRKRMDVA